MKTALIIGISGQDAAYLSKLLLEKGYHVVGITRDVLSTRFDNLHYLGIKPEIEIIENHSSEPSRIKRILGKFKPVEIYNLGAQSSVGHSFKDPIETISYNTVSVLIWLEEIKNLQLNTRFYQASSSEMFGNVGLSSLPLTESLLFHPASPYGISKAAAHWITVNYREAHNLFGACGILFNHESTLRGSSFVVKKVINAAVRIKLGLSDLPILVGNTSIRRDWGYAPKYVDAMWRILQHATADDFLICSGNVMSLEDLITMVMGNLDLDIEKYIKVDPELFRPVDLEEIYGDNTKAKELLNWEYNMSNEQLVDALILDEYHHIEWEKKNLRN